MKKTIALVIAALMITSFAATLSTTTVVSTTTVISPTTFSAAPGVITVTPTSVGAGKYTFFTLAVNNDTGDNIAKILVRIAGFDNALGGEENFRAGTAHISVSDNWVNLAENLLLAKKVMSQVTDNMTEANTNLSNAGIYLKQAGENLKLAGDDMISTAAPENVGASGTYFAGTNRAGDDWITAGNALKSAPIDLKAVSSALENAAADFALAAGTVDGDGGEAVLLQVFYKFSDVENRSENAAINILGGNFRLAADNFENVVLAMNYAGENFGAFAGQWSGVQIREAGAKLENKVGTNLALFQNNLRMASDNLREAGVALGRVDNALLRGLRFRMNNENEVSGTLAYIPQIALDNFLNAAENLAAENIGAHGTGLYQENVLAAGHSLRMAALALSKEVGDTSIGGVTVLDTTTSNATAFKFRDFGSANMDIADNYLVKAGDNLLSRYLFDVPTAATNLTSFATYIGKAGDDIKATAALTDSTGWHLSETKNGDATWSQWGDNAIKDGTTKTLKFLWAVPAITATLDYTVHTWTYKNDNTQTSYETHTVSVDGGIPSLTLKVTQAGVAFDNIVGTAYADGIATITVTSSKVLETLGVVVVENSGSSENFRPVITMTTTDSLTYTGTFAVDNWDDNSVRVRIKAPSAIDPNGNENSTAVTTRVYVDTRHSIFVDNGLSVFTAIPWMRQPGTDKWFRVDNNALKKVSGRVEDNANLSGPFGGERGADNSRLGYENTKQDVVTVTIGDTTLTPTAAENFETTLTLVDGLNSRLTIKAVDWTGNENSMFEENVFIDTKVPTFTFNTITTTKGSETWTDGMTINDNKPTIKLTIKDPGYPDTGLGVLPENVRVYLTQENTDIENPNIWQMKLENKDLFTSASGVFENIIDNVGKGLLDGTYFVFAIATDNLRHGMKDNENASISFKIDTDAPSLQTPATAENPLDGSSVTDPTVQSSTALTLSGSSAEEGATITIYADDATTALTTATVDSFGRWDATISLVVGEQTKLEVTITDVVGNESSRLLYGYVIADGTAPSVSVTAPVTAGEDFTTDQESIEVSGNIGKDTWETYNSGTLAATATSQVGSAAAGVVTIESDGDYTISVALSEGTNTVTIRATDSAGNVGSAIIHVMRDGTAPSVSVTEPVATGESYFTDQESIEISGSIGKDSWEGYDSGDYTVTATSQVGSATAWDITIDSGGNYTVDVSLSEGTNTVTIKATDSAGNDTSASISVTRDGTSPSVSITAPVSITDQSSIQLSGSIGKDTWETYNSGDLAVTATSQVGSATEGVLTVDSGGNYSISVTLSEGANTVTIRATDAAGNADSASVSVTRDGTSPSVSVIAPVATGETYFTDKGSIELSGSIGRDTWEAYNSGALAVTATSQVGSATAGSITIDSGGSYTVSVTLSEGANTVTIKAFDSAGNADSASIFVNRDGTSPSVSIATPVATGDTYSTDQASIVVSGSIGRDTWEAYNSGALAVTATSQVGSATAGTLTIDSNGNYSISVALSEGANTVTIRASDSAGNVDSASISVTRTVTPWATYAIIIVIVALILAAIAIFRKR